MQEIKDFRFGNIASIYYEITGEKLPKQLDLIDTWFPGLVIVTDDSDGETKRDASYADYEYMIHAMKYHGKLYSGSSTRVSQIAGRLIGTAAGNKEKERKAAELIQKHVADCFVNDMTLTPRLKDNAVRLFDRLSGEQLDEMEQILYELVLDLAKQRASVSDYDRKTELFAMDDETFDGTIYNAAYQLRLETFAGLCNCYLWLLTGSLLRNEVGRVLRLYDSSFIAIRRQISETGELTDKLNYLFHSEQYWSTFDGDENDLKERFPDVEWYCDQCGEHLNEQEGFDDHLPVWKCTKCGYENKLDYSEIYDNDEDWKNRVNPVDVEKFKEAIEYRRAELEAEKRGKGE